MKDTSASHKGKPLMHFDSLDDMQDYGLLRSRELTPEDRLREMTALNLRLYGSPIPPDNKTLSVFVAQPGESLHDFYTRINKKDY